MACNKDDLTRLFEDEGTVKDLELKFNEFLSSTKIFEILRDNDLVNRLNVSLTLAIDNDDLKSAPKTTNLDSTDTAFSISSTSGKCGYILINGVWTYVCIA
jgi:hypothetical protein